MRAYPVFGLALFGLSYLACRPGRPTPPAHPQAESSSKGPDDSTPSAAAAPSGAADAGGSGESVGANDAGVSRDLTHFGVQPSGRCCDGDTRVLLTIPFEVSSTRIPATAGPTLRTVYDLLASHPEYRVEVDGHADRREAAAGARLATSRADEVKAALMALGADGGRLTTAGCGTRMPVFQPPGGREVDSCVSFLLRGPDEKPCVP
jgi:outer membrane protein OmpA-like peptidoglycan-associated protein